MTDEQRRERMLTASMGELIPRVALPSIISMLVGAVYNLADTFFVGKLGTSATGAIGVVFPLMSLLMAFSFIFAHGASSCIARKLGAGERERASRIVTTCLAFAMLTGLIYGAVGLVLSDQVLTLFGATPTILPYARDYAAYIFAAAPLFAGSYVMNNALRAEGSAVLALVGMSSGAVLNIILDPIFIFALDMGVAGAGCATMIGQCFSFLLLISFYLKKKKPDGGRFHSVLSIRPEFFTPERAFLGEITFIGVPSFFRQGLNSLAAILLNSAAGAYGDAAIAAFSVVGRLTWIVSAVLVGYGQGFQPICGFNYGAGHIDRVWSSFRFTLLTSLAFMSASAVILITGADWFVALFRDDADVIAIGVRTLRWQAAALPLQTVVMTATMLYQATGRALSALVLTLCRQGLCFIPIVLILPVYFGIAGLEAAQALSDALAFLIALPLVMSTVNRYRHCK